MKKKPLIIAGVSLAILGIGYAAYKIIQRAKYNVIQGEHNTILVAKEEAPKDKVESVGWENPSTDSEPIWETPQDDIEKQLADFESQSIFGMGN